MTTKISKWRKLTFLISKLVRLVNVRGFVFLIVVNRLVVRAVTINKTDTRLLVCLFARILLGAFVN